MTIAAWLEETGTLDGTTMFPPLSRMQIARRLSSAGISLPAGHIEFLELSDGLMVYGGYFRLFGVDDLKSINLISWNDPETWKFAWEKKADRFLCFGQNAWGDQYAYRLGDLTGQVEEPPILSIDASELEMILEWSCFTEFFDEEIVRNSVATYDSLITAARPIHGDLAMNESLIFSPSLMIGGPADPENAMKMPSATAMIANGDIWRQTANLQSPRTVVGVVPSPDDKGRMRMRVVFAD